MKKNFKQVIMTAALITAVGATTTFASDGTTYFAKPTGVASSGNIISITGVEGTQAKDEFHFSINREGLPDEPHIAITGGAHFFMDGSSIEQRIDESEALTDAEKTQLKALYAEIKPTYEKAKELMEQLREADSEARTALSEELSDLMKEISAWTVKNEDLLNKIMPNFFTISLPNGEMSFSSFTPFFIGSGNEDMTKRIEESETLTAEEKAALLESNAKMQEIHDKMKALQEEMNTLIESDRELWDKAGLGLSVTKEVKRIPQLNQVDLETESADF